MGMSTSNIILLVIVVVLLIFIIFIYFKPSLLNISTPSSPPTPPQATEKFNEDVKNEIDEISTTESEDEGSEIEEESEQDEEEQDEEEGFTDVVDKRIQNQREKNRKRSKIETFESMYDSDDSDNNEDAMRLVNGGTIDGQDDDSGGDKEFFSNYVNQVREEKRKKEEEKRKKTLAGKKSLKNQRKFRMEDVSGGDRDDQQYTEVGTEYKRVKPSVNDMFDTELIASKQKTWKPTKDQFDMEIEDDSEILGTFEEQIQKAPKYRFGIFTQSARGKRGMRNPTGEIPVEPASFDEVPWGRSGHEFDRDVKPRMNVI